ncbi:uncharacterized protein LOC119676005 [Teleopsis dalmanni]|uniref:uncharacterized protein LOC119676005 n=1 Tax=Teleopsis dalmanni TaxID=139649 RepID=UPI0018CFCFC4|nr:uncharacterized protein LOC119676005 [Teleopsis dalmanni]
MSRGLADIAGMTATEKLNMLCSLFQLDIRALDLKMSLFIKCVQSKNFQQYIDTFPPYFRNLRGDYNIEALRSYIAKIPPLEKVWNMIEQNEIDRLELGTIRLLFWVLLENKCANIIEYDVDNVINLIRTILQTAIKRPDYVFEIVPTNNKFFENIKKYHDLMIESALFVPQMETFQEVFSNDFKNFDTIILKDDLQNVLSAGENLWKNSMLGTQIRCVGFVNYIRHVERMEFTGSINDSGVEIYDNNLATLSFVMVYKTDNSGLLGTIWKNLCSLCKNNEAIIAGSVVGIILDVLLYKAFHGIKRYLAK